MLSISMHYYVLLWSYLHKKVHQEPPVTLCY